MKEIPPSVKIRPCDGCTICCSGHLVGIAFGSTFGFGKPCIALIDDNNTSVSKGCSRYEKRPYTCKSYYCGWSQSLIDEKYKPDLCGWLMSIEQDPEGQYIRAIQFEENANREALDDIIRFAKEQNARLIVTNYKEHSMQTLNNIKKYITGNVNKDQEPLTIYSIMNKQEKPTDIKINLGCGRQVLPGYLNIDKEEQWGIYPEIDANSILRIDLDDEKLSIPLPNDCVSEVRAHHVLEHIGVGFFRLLQELYRICQNNAIIDIVVPHPRHDVFLGDPTHIRPITVETMAMFSKKNNLKNIATPVFTLPPDLVKEPIRTETPFALLLGVDFEVISKKYVLDPIMEKITENRDDPELDTYARIYNNVIVEIHFKMAVRKEGI